MLDAALKKRLRSVRKALITDDILRDVARGFNAPDMPLDVLRRRIESIDYDIERLEEDILHASWSKESQMIDVTTFADSSKRMQPTGVVSIRVTWPDGRTDRSKPTKKE